MSERDWSGETPGSTEAFVNRHSIKPGKEMPQSEQYPGITPEGVELSAEKARTEIAEMIEKAPAGSIIFMGGATEAIRTKSTSRVFGGELKRVFQSREDIMVVTEQDLEINTSEEPEFFGKTASTIKKIQEIIQKNPDRKIVIDVPLFIREFSMSEWVDKKTGGLNEYANALLAKHNEDDEACVRDWLRTQGRLENSDLIGPDPTEIAKSHVRGIQRLHDFAEKYSQGRNVIVGVSGHSWNLDAFAVYLSNNGMVNEEGYEKLGGEMIKPSEIAQIKVSREGRPSLVYRNQEFPIEVTEEAA